jgi:AcrR family transcriptional regulator
MKSLGASRRPYRMVARAESTAATRARVIEAAIETFWSAPSREVSLDRVAARAGVSIQTVIRHFGSKDGLFDAAVEHQTAGIERQRNEAPIGDVDGAIRVLMDHYEEFGDRALRLLAEEQLSPNLQRIVDIGRASHRTWCERVFAPALVGRKRLDRHRRLAQFVAICDVYTWKLLRKDARLSRRQTEIALIEMLNPLLEVNR